MAAHRTLRASEMVGRDAYFMMTSVVVPRPIAWVSTIAGDGSHNLAPHSFFSVASEAPPVLLFTSIGTKDTVRNVRETGDFVVNIASHELVERMNLTSANAPHGVSEFGLAGLTPLASEAVASPRVAEAPVSMECRLDRIVDFGDGRSHVIFGEVLVFHVAERVFDQRGRVEPGLLDAVARMGASTYCTTRDRFDLRRPSYEDLVDDASDALR